MKNRKLYVFSFLLIIISYIKFFEYKPLIDFSNLLIYPVFLALFIFTFKRFLKSKGLFSFSIKLIVCSLFFAIIPSVLYWKQDLFYSVLAIAPYSYFLLFYFLIDARIKQKTIITILLSLAYIGLILYFFQLFFFKSLLFGYKGSLKEDRGILRLVFPGEGFMFFALFYYLNKLGQKFNIKYLVLLIPFLLMMLLQVTRIYIFACGLIAIYHFMIKAKNQYRIYAILVFIFCYSFYYTSDNSMVKGIRDANKSELNNKEDNIRLVAATYYLFVLSPNNSTYLLGNGAYHNRSLYGKKMLGLNKKKHFFLEDLGLFKGYILFGILFVIGYVIIFFKSFTVKIPYDKLYLKYYIWTILIISFTTRANANGGFGVVLVSVLYLFEFASLEQEKLLGLKKTI